MDIRKQCQKMRYTQKPKDIYYTPEDCVQDLLSKFDKYLSKDDLVLDASAGKGVFYNNYPDRVIKDWCEIEKGRDFLRINSKVDWVITNPPFSKINLFLNKCSEICNKGFMLLLPIHAITPKRLDDLKKKGFSLTRMHLFKVMQWFGLSCFCVFEKSDLSIISFTRKIYQAKADTADINKPKVETQSRLEEQTEEATSIPLNTKVLSILEVFI